MWRLWWALRGKSVPVSCTSVLFLLYFCMCVCVLVCVHVSVPASQLSNAFLPVSSRCVLSYQACQTLTFRRCLLLDSIARLPKPEGKRHFPSSLHLHFTVTLSISHLLLSPSTSAFIPLCRSDHHLTFWISSQLKTLILKNMNDY